MQIEFDEKTHTYVVDGVLTPSVTTLITEIWMKDKYSNVSRSVMDHAAKYGSKVHSLIEYWNDHEDVPEWYEAKSYEGIALRRYIRLKELHQIVPMKQEVPVAYIHNGHPLYAGKFDMVGMIDGCLSLVDNKSTAKLDMKYLSIQLTLYKAAISQTLGIEVEKLFAMWLPKKHLGDLYDISEMNMDVLIDDIVRHNEQINSSERQDVLPY